jgi:5-methylcytosine-specific restriction protein A
MSSDRVEFTRKVKLAALRRCKGLCEACGKPLFADYQFDHENPAAFCSDGSEDNCQVLHKKCHAEKTARDIKAIAKSNRIRARHNGVTRDRTILGWRNFKGEIIRKPRER